MQDVKARFAALRNGSLTLAQASGAERAQRLRAILAAVLKNKQRFYDAAHTEMKACDLDVAAQLVMVKSEIDFVAKRVSDWMKPRRVRNSAATLGKKCYVLYEPKGVVLNLSTWNAPIAIALVPAVAAISAGNAFALKPSELAPHSASVLKEVLEGALVKYPGAMILVTHDRALIDAVATRTWAIEDGGIREVLGGYTALLRARDRERHR